MANKFKVGDKIRAIDDSYPYTSKTNGWEGEVVRINRFGELLVKTTKMRPEKTVTAIIFTVLPHHFERITNPEIHITVKGNETIAVYRNGDEYKKAVAKCSPEDTFDFGIGAKLALERLGVLPTTKEETPVIKEEPKYYNGKVVCVEVGINAGLYTVGKVYQFKDGVLINDKGETIIKFSLRGGRFTSFEDFKSFSKSKWVELIEDEPNEPLTTEELMKMDGQKVWLLSLGSDYEELLQKDFGGWHTVNVSKTMLINAYCDKYDIGNNGVPFGFRAYRKPLEGYEE